MIQNVSLVLQVKSSQEGDAVTRGGVSASCGWELTGVKQVYSKARNSAESVWVRTFGSSPHPQPEVFA